MPMTHPLQVERFAFDKKDGRLKTELNMVGEKQFLTMQNIMRISARGIHSQPCTDKAGD